MLARLPLTNLHVLSPCLKEINIFSGIIDDIYGANFVDGGKDGNVQDQNGHGTFIVGVVGAAGNNALGVTGINQIANVASCRFMDATGNGWVSDAIRCMDYCMSFNAHIIQASWGGVAYSDSLQVGRISSVISWSHSDVFLLVQARCFANEGCLSTAHFPIGHYIGCKIGRKKALSAFFGV